MATYRLYLETDLNRVFTGSLGPIAAAELDVLLAHSLGAPETKIEHVVEGRTGYLRFDHDGDRADLVAGLTWLSATAAVFVEHSPGSLEPLPLAEPLAFGTEVVTTQRYKGKTNERLTRLMLNLARATESSTATTVASVLDPMCGRGTTLNWALLYGMRSTGLDVDRHALDEYATFLQQWAQGHRYPHRLQRFKKQDGEFRHFDFTVAADRKALERKEAPDISTYHAPADSESITPGRHTMIVSDLPYGVQHRARTGPRSEPISVLELVERLAVHWPGWLLPGGSVSLAWNVRSVPVGELLATLRDAGFDDVATQGFGHQVDRTITRDVVVARRQA